MTNHPSDAQRRMLLQAAAGIAAAGALGLNGASAAPGSPAATGKPGDFDFLTGEWKIAHRRLKDGKWDQFDGEATVVGILGGVVSVEELRIPSRNFNGMGLRMLDVERKVWADYWVNGQNGVMNPPSWGTFTNGIGPFDADETDAGKPVIVRGEWEQLAPGSCRWRQSVSRDGGKTWEENWIMHWRRVKV
jgi:hypothetical protein